MKTIIIIVIVCAFILFYRKYKSHYPKMSIPKIIHQTAPADMNKWHKIWKPSQKTWKDKFPDFEYIMWTDEDLDAFIRTEYEWFYDTYKSYDVNIKRIDAARYFILFHYGGMYADMDMSSNANFWYQIPQDKVSIAANPWPEWMFWKARIQNALMISPKNHPVWKEVWKALEEHKDDEDVLDATGPKLIEGVYNKFPEMFNVLKKVEFIQSTNLTYNPIIKLDDPDPAFVEHHATTSWGSGKLNSMYKMFNNM
jgi:mannosyltransferase OCH1-like enzyme